jgi:two-component system, chemotaxis family, protein-glutamate methylesterase/glutaminase
MSDRNSTRDIIVIGGSAGALGPLVQIAAAMPKDIPASFLVVLHASADSPGLLPRIIGRSSALEVRHAVDGEALERGTMYLAPPDRHLLLRPEGIEVGRGPRENRSRPAIDPLFRTAARSFGPRVVGVLLSGMLNDGTYGLMIIRQSGGIAIVQDPRQAEFPDMPASAIDDVEVDHVLPAIEIANRLKELVEQPVAAEVVPMRRDRESRSGDQEKPESDALDQPGELSPFVCPDCGGALWERRHGKLYRYRCHTGHAFTAETLLSGQAEELEAALWAALRTLQENAEMSQRLATRAAEAGRAASAQQHREHANETERRAEVLRRLLGGTDAAA